MSVFARAYEYALAHSAELSGAVGGHLVLASIALGAGLLLGLPLGALTARSRALALPVITAVAAVRVIPSLAILFLALPYFGLTITSAAVALAVLAVPPLLLNTDAAFRSLDPTVREAAEAMGMSPWERMRRVEIPLAMPVVVAGIRTATVEVIASATLAAFIGGGGLGIYVTRGFALYDSAILLVGAVPVAALALAAEAGLGAVQRTLQREVAG